MKHNFQERKVIAIPRSPLSLFAVSTAVALGTAAVVVDLHALDAGVEIVGDDGLLPVEVVLALGFGNLLAGGGGGRFRVLFGGHQRAGPAVGSVHHDRGLQNQQINFIT